MCHTVPLHANRRFPTAAAAASLKFPFQEMREQHFQAANQLATFTLTHVFDLLREVLYIRFREASGAQELGVPLGPLEEVLLVEVLDLRSESGGLHTGSIT